MARTGREHGLTSPQGQLLCVLMAGPRGMGELTAMLSPAQSSLTGLVDRTERNGLVRREPDPRDTRAVRVALTPRGSFTAGHGTADPVSLGRWAGEIAPAVREAVAKETT